MLNQMQAFLHCNWHVHCQVLCMFTHALQGASWSTACTWTLYHNAHICTWGDHDDIFHALAVYLIFWLYMNTQYSEKTLGYDFPYALTIPAQFCTLLCKWCKQTFWVTDGNMNGLSTERQMQKCGSISCMHDSWVHAVQACVSWNFVWCHSLFTNTTWYRLILVLIKDMVWQCRESFSWVTICWV